MTETASAVVFLLGIGVNAWNHPAPVLFDECRKRCFALPALPPDLHERPRFPGTGPLSFIGNRRWSQTSSQSPPRPAEACKFFAREGSRAPGTEHTLNSRDRKRFGYRRLRCKSASAHWSLGVDIGPPLSWETRRIWHGDPFEDIPRSVTNMNLQVCEQARLLEQAAYNKSGDLARFYQRHREIG